MKTCRFALTSILLSVCLLAGCSSNGINTKSTDDNRINKNGFYKPLATPAPGSMPTNFTDVPSGEWYTGHIQWGSNLGIIDGYPDHTFHPNSPITRAEAMKIFRSLSDKGYLNVPAAPSPVPTSPVTSPVVPSSPAPTS
jgi:hypothetical protein